MLSALLELVLPRTCLGCARPGMGLCPRCRATGDPLCVELDGLTVLAAAPYEGTTRAALLHYKERGRRELAEPLGALLARAVAGLESPAAIAPVLVPVPSPRPVARVRGGQHVARVTRVAGARTAVPVTAALRVTRRADDSARLGAGARARNVAGTLAATAPPRAGLGAVLVDDIVTTGATLLEARRALLEAGWVVLGAATVAATLRRSSRLPGSGPRGPVGSSVRCT
jgi:predicted amidophosphoribosyltransferase